jgi:mono/diheme cytochrome c family protein
MIAALFAATVLLALVLSPAAAPAADLAAGKQLNDKLCARCHGDAGKGDGAMLKKMKSDVTPVDWTDKAAMTRLKDSDLAQIIKEGGKTSGKSKLMPGFKDKLSDAEVADVVAYIRSLGK